MTVKGGWLPRALANFETQGFVQLLADANSKESLGAKILDLPCWSSPNRLLILTTSTVQQVRDDFDYRAIDLVAYLKSMRKCQCEIQFAERLA